MRSIYDLMDYEIKEINEILKTEYYYSDLLKTAQSIEYQCFSKSHSIYSGIGVIKVYKYLLSVGIDVLSDKSQG